MTKEEIKELLETLWGECESGKDFEKSSAVLIELLYRLTEKPIFRREIEKVLYEMENHISGNDCLPLFAYRIRELLKENERK